LDSGRRLHRSTDTRFAEKVAEKTNSMKSWQTSWLKMYEYDVHLRPMPLGYAGTIYNCNLSMLQDLGLQRTVAKGVLQKLDMHAITSLQNIMTKRIAREQRQICAAS